MISISIIIFAVVYSIPYFKSHIKADLMRRICAISCIYAGVLAFNTLYIQSIGEGIGLYSGYIQHTVISTYIAILLCVLSAIILIAWPNFSKTATISFYLNREVEYCLVIIFFLLGAILLISSADLISMYLSIELQSFSLYILAGIYTNKFTSSSASLKYFLLGGLSSSLILLGVALIYSFIGTTNTEAIYAIYSTYQLNMPFQDIDGGTSLVYGNEEAAVIVLGFVFIISGLLFKVSASPFHNWAPDVYDETPTIVTTWLTIMPKLSIFIFLLELVLSFSPSHTLPYFPLEGVAPAILNGESMMLPSPASEKIASAIITKLLLISSILSLIIGSFLGLAQLRVKRLLAYSTISHVGFMLLALAVNNAHSVESFIFYLIQYSVTNLNVFLILLALGNLLNKDNAPATSSLHQLPFSPKPISNLHNGGLEGREYAEAQARIRRKSEGLRMPGVLNLSTLVGDGPADRQLPSYPLSLGNVRNLAKDLGVATHPQVENGRSALRLINNRSPIHLSTLVGSGRGDVSDIELINTLKGLFKFYPLLTLSLSLCLFSFAGIPPFIGFFAKAQVLYSSNSAGYYFLSLIAILVSVISASYYLKIVKIIHFDKSVSPAPIEVTPIATVTSNTPVPGERSTVSATAQAVLGESAEDLSNTSLHYLAIATLTLSLILFILSPELLLNLTKLSTLYLFNI